MRRAFAGTLVAFFVVCMASTALAGWRQVLPDAQLIGAGQMRYWGFAIYQAQLWSPYPAAEVLTLQRPFALQLTYQRSISREALVDASLEEMRRLAAHPLTPEQLANWQAQMQQAFVDVRDGEQITGVYLPNKGVQFYVGQRLSHEVDDPAFARAFFLIWLDPRTRNPQLRAQLLGND